MGKWSVINGYFAGVFLVLTSICFFFPTNFDDNMHQTAVGFNYTIAVFTGALLIAGTYWFLPKSLGGARHFFTGPVRPEDLDENGMFKDKKFIIKNKSKQPQPDATSFATGGGDSPQKMNYESDKIHESSVF